jgi:hypothetical protein
VWSSEAPISRAPSGGSDTSALSGQNGGAGSGLVDSRRGEPGSAGREEPDEDRTASGNGESTPLREVMSAVRLPGPARVKRPATLSLEVRFESVPEDLTLGRLVESTVWVNDAHPAYRRAVNSRAEGYHIALTVAAALAPLAVELAHTQTFINRFLARWGEAAGKG